MSEKRLIITQAHGYEYEQMTQFSCPLMQIYADKINADFILMKGKGNCIAPLFRKFDMKDVVNGYDRWMFLDVDILVDPESPDLFNLVPYGTIGAKLNNGIHICRVRAERTLDWFNGNQISRVNGEPTLVPYSNTWDGLCFNSGVMVMDWQSNILCDFPREMQLKYLRRISKCDEPLFAMVRAAYNIPIFNIGEQFNGYNRRPFADNVCFYHYLGDPDRLQKMEEDYKIIMNR
jgi:lipopolysaccharide biosynthesis glycosyltransferase